MNPRFSKKELAWLENLVTSAIVRRDDEINGATTAEAQNEATKEKSELNVLLAKIQSRRMAPLRDRG